MLGDKLRLTVNRKRATASGVEVAKITAVARAFLADQAGVERVWTADEIAAGSGPAPFAALYRNSFDPKRSGDLSIQPVRTCFITPHPAGTGHGSPYLYDRRVPLVFFGAGVEPAVVRGPAATVDIAPTLAALLGVPAPAGLDGRRLPLRGPAQ